MISAITYMLDDGWYSKREPGSQPRRQLAKRARRLPRSRNSSGRNGACGKPAVCVKSCSTVTTSLPCVPNSGTIAATRSFGSSLPSCISSQPAAEVIAFVAEKTT